MRKRHLLIGIIVIILSSYYAFRNVPISELKEAFASVHYLYLLPAVALIALTFFFRAVRWRYLVNSVKEIKTSRLFSPLMVGFMGNMLPARAGEFIRAYLLGKNENVSFSASFATIFVERLLDLAVVLLLLLWALFFGAGALTGANTGTNHRLMDYMIHFGWVSFTLFAVILLFSALLQYRNDLAMKAVVFFSRPFPERWREKISVLVISFNSGLKILKDWRGFLAAAIFSLLVWAGILLTYYALHLAFGIETSLPVVYSLVIITLSVAIFITLFPTPAFLGSFQAGCVVALHEVFGIPKALAASYGIIAWLITMAFIVTAGTVFVVRDNISIREFSTVRGKLTDGPDAG